MLLKTRRILKCSYPYGFFLEPSHTPPQDHQGSMPCTAEETRIPGFCGSGSCPCRLTRSSKAQVKRMYAVEIIQLQPQMPPGLFSNWCSYSWKLFIPKRELILCLLFCYNYSFEDSMENIHLDSCRHLCCGSV